LSPPGRRSTGERQAKVTGRLRKVTEDVAVFARFDEAMRAWGSLTAAELRLAHALFRPRSVPVRTVLQRPGEPPERVSFLVRGLTRMFVVTEGGADRTLGFRIEGSLVCAYAASLAGGPAMEFIETLERCELLTADRAAFHGLCARVPAWSAVLTAQTRQLLVTAQSRSRHLLADDAATRYRVFVTENPELARRLTLRQIASYVGVTPEALSRIRRDRGHPRALI
jgi:CRP-like cAMP-binding protein